MAIRCLLHKDKLPEFQSWLDSQEIENRPGRGDWQLLQVRAKDGKGWDVLYERLEMKEHVTVPDPMVQLVRRFISESNHGG
jgi:hypothetical protein